jgi:tRNA G26 N,N-dimethylase Trm1
MARGKRQKTDDGEEETLVVFQEGMVRCVVAAKGAKQPGSVPGFCNVKMKVNRDVSMCAVAAAAMERTEREPSLPPMKCIDAFTSSGILGLRWAVESTKVSECNLEITLNDLAEECC